MESLVGFGAVAFTGEGPCDMLAGVEQVKWLRELPLSLELPGEGAMGGGEMEGKRGAKVAALALWSIGLSPIEVIPTSRRRDIIWEDCSGLYKGNEG